MAWIAGLLLAFSFLYSCGGDDDSTNSDPQLDTVKGFVRDVRTWSTVIKKEFDAPSMRLDKDTTAASQILDSTLPLVSDSFGLVLKAALQAYIQKQSVTLQSYIDQEKTTHPNLVASATGQASYDAVSQLVVVSGTITLTETITDSTGVASVVTKTQTVNNLSISFPSTSGTVFTITFNGGSVENEGASMLIEPNSYATIEFVSAVDTIIPQIDGTVLPPPLPDADLLDINFNVTISQKSQGNGETLFSFTGTLAAKLVAPKDANGNVYYDSYGSLIANPANFVFGGVITSSIGDSFSGEFKFGQTNADTFVPLQPPYAVNQINPKVSSYTLDATTFSMTLPDYQLTVTSVGLNEVRVDETWGNPPYYTSTWNYPTTLSQYLAIYAANQVYYVDVVNEGLYVVTLPATFVEPGEDLAGVMLSPSAPEEDATNYRTFSLDFSYKLKLAELPEAKFVISGEVVAYQTANITMSISYGVRDMTITGTVTNGQQTGSLIVTNQAGMVLRINFDRPSTSSKVGEVIFNGSKFGDIEQLSDGTYIVRYSDGSFESLSSF